MTRKGFTLIELLVVITIMGILFTLSLASFSAARRQSRDAKRKTDLEMIRSGLEIYKSDCNIYPPSPLGASLVGSGTPISCAVANTYISLVPTDPLPGRLYPYSYSAATKTYTLCASLEQGGTAVSCSGSCGSGVTCNYKVTNP